MRWSCRGFFGRTPERAAPFPRSLEGWFRISLRRTTAMPHELIVGLEAAAVGVLVLLLVPKRGVDHIRERFADLKRIEARPLISVKWWLERQALAEATATSNGAPDRVRDVRNEEEDEEEPE